MCEAVRLRCEFAEHPLGLGTARPRLSWEASSDEPGRAVVAYQVLVASSAEVLATDVGDLWDSGRCVASETPLVEYDGSALQSRQRAWWKVRLWDEVGRVGQYSEPDWFELALLDSADWIAEWLGHAGSSSGGALYLRRPFVLDAAPARARLYVTGLGWYEAYLNGQKVGSAVLDPAPTDTGERVQYSTHDVTDLVRAGRNVLGGVLGHGWSGSQKLLAQLEITLADGRTVVVATGNHFDIDGWMAFRGPVVEDSVYDGETFDSRLENPQWTLAGPEFTAAPMRELFHAMRVEAPAGILEARPQEPIEVVDTLQVASVTRPAPGVFVVDTGQNLAGWLRLAADGPSGTTITLRYAESLTADGLVDQANLRSAQACDTWILNGSGRQQWEPAFTYHGFRYVQVDGYPGELTPTDVEVRVVRSAMSVRGAFECDDDLINAISRAVEWTEVSNVHGVPTDCPQRNERMGWLNDLAARSEELVHTFDTARFLPKWVQDIADTQDAAGAIADTAPYHFGARPADPVSVCFALIPWLLVTHHGDLRTAGVHYESIRRWYDYLTSRAEDGIVRYSYYGDWAPPAGEALESADGISAVAANTPGELISTAHYYLTGVLLQRLAAVLGREAEAADLAARVAETASVFHDAFYRGEGVGYGSGNQACNAVALQFGLVPPAHVEDTVAALVADIRAHRNHLTTGNLCTRYALETLVDHGHGDLALAVVTQTDYPSWGYMLANGATTIWERWEYATGGGMNSHNHPMYASVGAWFYRRLAGIQVPDDSIGMSRVIIRPPLDLTLGRASASLATVRGALASSWQRDQDEAVIDLTIPVGTRADVELPPDWNLEAPSPGDPTATAAHSTTLAAGTHRLTARRSA